MAAANLASSDNAASMAMDDHRRNLELLLLAMMVHSLLRKEKEGADDDAAAQLEQMKMKFSMAINSAVSEELLVIARRLLGEQLRSLGGGENEGRAAVSSAASDHQLMDGAAAAKKKTTAAAAKKKRNKRNKAAAKHKKSSLMSWLGGGIMSLLMMAAFGSITTLVALSLIHQSDGSSEGKAPPTLPPSTSTSLRHRNRQSINVASTSPSSVSPLAAVVQAPIFSPSPAVVTASNPPMNTFDETAPSTCSAPSTCFDTPNWEDGIGRGCDWYEENDEPGCFLEGCNYEGIMGLANHNCCYCGGGSIIFRDDYKSKCQDYTAVDYWASDPDLVKNICDTAASCVCETADPVKILTNPMSIFFETVGLYNGCKCDFWSNLCEETGVGAVCDYAAEYCCGDYEYYTDYGDFQYLNSPLCYCDFFNYAQKEFGYTLKPKALNISTEFANPCGMYLSRSDTEYERESLEAIYNATNGQKWTNNDGWMIESDQCQWYGISCDDEGHVTSIDLRDNNLEGQFPVYTRIEPRWGDPILDNNWYYSMYGLANLYKLKTLDLSNNKLSGTIDYRPLYNLYVLTHFDVSGNQLSGEVDALVAPSLTYVDFSNNNFTSMRRFQKYKKYSSQTLRDCDVSDNAIKEDAYDLLENVPPNIVQFIASNNQIYGSLPDSLNNLQKLRQFNMASNSLSGALPGFTESFATLQKLDLSNQDQTSGFTGSIPENIWRSLSLKVLNLAGNKLTGIIPALVGNLAVLEEFDVSNNHLNSSLPTELGMLDGSLKRLVLSNNSFSGTIPSQIGQLQGASVFLKGNRFYNSSATDPAPLSLCLKRKVEEFDLVNDNTLCPIERNALSEFYESAKGAEWTDQGNKANRSLWLNEYESYCYWKGVTCDDDKNHVTKLQLSNNGLSGKLSGSIGELKFIEKLDLSDNDMKGSIPAEIGQLTNLKYLRLSYNAFTGAAPEGLGGMKGLQLLQLQSNRITLMPQIPWLNDSIHGQSTFVTDCGVPSDFEKALECGSCTMCCNANEDCHPQQHTRVQEMMGNKGYKEFATVCFACFFIVCCMIVLLLYVVDRRKSHGSASASAREQKRRDDEYALSKIGKNSVYSYFVTNSKFGWIAALTTVVIQIGILSFFIMASEANLQNDGIDIQFTWKCPRDKDECKNKQDLDGAGWFIFSVLVTVFLAKDIISGSKLIYHSAKSRHDRYSRIRYFCGGMILCSITLFAVYVSTVYNTAIATSNTELIMNSVFVLFIMELDEWIFSDLEAINEKWTKHAADRSECGTTLDTDEAGKGSMIDEMKEEIALQKVQITSQQGQIASLQEDLRMLHEIVEKLQESQAPAAETKTASDLESFFECEGDTNA